MATSTSSRVLRVGRYVLLDTIGEGAFGRVKLAINEETGNEYAVKILAKSDIIAHDLTLQVRREIAVMKALRHRSIVRLVEVLTSPKHLYIVIELVTGGELFDLVANHGRLSEQTARRYFHQLVDAVAYCHSRRVYHRDLKPENLLLSEDGTTLKITDFGLSSIKRADTSDELLHTVTGSPHYIPPEVITHAANGYEGDKADAWAVGMILYGMLAGFLPFDDNDTSSLYRKIVHHQVEYPSHFSQSAIQLLRELFRKDPKQRANMERVREFDWFLIDYQPKLAEEGTSARRRRKQGGSSTRRHRRPQVTDSVGNDPVGNEIEIVTNSAVGNDKESMSSNTQSQSQTHLEQEKRQSVPSGKHIATGLAQSRNDVMGPLRPTSLRATTTIMPIIAKSRHDSLPVSRVVRRPHARLHKREQVIQNEEDSLTATVPVTRVDSEPLRGHTKRPGGDKVSSTGSVIAAAFRRPFWRRSHHHHQNRPSPEVVASTGSASDVSPLQLDRAGLEEPISGSGSRSMNLLSKARGFASTRSTRASRKSTAWEPETPPSQSLTSFPPNTVTNFQHTSPISPDAQTSMVPVFNALRDGTDDRLRTKQNRNIARIPSRRSELRSSNTTVHSTPRVSFDSSVPNTQLFVNSQGSTEYGTPEPRSAQSAHNSSGFMHRQLSLNDQLQLPTGATITPSSVRCSTPVPRQQSVSPRQATPQLAKNAHLALARDELGESASTTHENGDWNAAQQDKKRMLTTNELSMFELPVTSFLDTIAGCGGDQTMTTRSSHIFKPTTLQFISEECSGYKSNPPHPLCPPSLQVDDVEFPVWGIDEFEVFDDVAATYQKQVQTITLKPPQNETPPSQNETPPPQKIVPAPRRTIFAPLNSALIHKLSRTTQEVPLEKTLSRTTNR